MNLPNKLTLLRIVISFFFLVFLFVSAPGAKTVALILFAAGAVTDIYDGRLARRLGQITDLGKIIDPLADKILISSAFISFVQLNPINIPAWMAALIVGREFGVTALRFYAASKGHIIPAGQGGKHKMASQTTVITAGLISLSIREITILSSSAWNPRWDNIISAVMWGMTFLAVIHTLATGLYYLWEYRGIAQKNEG